MSKFTTVYSTQFSRFFILFTRWRDPRQVHVFSKVQKKCLKVDPNQRDLPRIIHFDHFFSTFFKSSFQNPTVLRGVSTPHMPPAKSDYFPNNGRTNGRNIWFWLADGRKERFAQKWSETCGTAFLMIFAAEGGRFFLNQGLFSLVGLNYFPPPAPPDKSARTVTQESIAGGLR